MGDLKNGNLFSHSSESWKHEEKAPTESFGEPSLLAGTHNMANLQCLHWRESWEKPLLLLLKTWSLVNQGPTLQC